MESPLILHIETSGKNCSVAVSKGLELLCLCEENEEQFSHSAKLHHFIEWALEGAEIAIKDLHAISVSKGPGSYTGLRIGVSAAKGLAFGLDVPLIATQTLRTLAVPFFDTKFDHTFSTLIARKQEIYVQNIKKIDDDSVPELIVLDKNFFSPFLEQKNLIVGNASERIKDLINKNYPDQLAHFNFQDVSKVSAQNAIAEALRKFQNADWEDVAYFEPEYIKPVFITPPKSSKA